MRYFTLKELTKSDTALKRGIDNTPNALERENLEALVKNILDPLRKAYGKPIIVTSGFRNEALNNAVGGSKTSQHRTGLAADIRTVKDTKSENKKLFDLIRKLNLPFDLLIDEYNFNWVHVSYSDRNRRLVLAIK